MDTSSIISTNLTNWMAATPGLDTLQKLEAKSKVGFSTIRRAKNGDGNITVEKLTAIAVAFGRTPAELMTPASTEAVPAHALDVVTPPAEAVESLARVLAEQSAEVARRWIALPPARRETLLAALRAESREAGNPGEGQILPTPTRKRGPAAATPPDTEEHRAGD